MSIKALYVFSTELLAELNATNSNLNANADFKTVAIAKSIDCC
jgi:hypothetical protein